GDHADRVLRLASVSAGEGGGSLQTPIDVLDAQGRRLPAEDLVVGSEVVAFRTREGALCDATQGAVTADNCASAPPGCSSTAQCDLNGDGDCCDDVLEAWDVAHARLVNSGRTVTSCQLEACDPRTPYKVIGQTVRFLEREPQQDEDLNHDGDRIDLVVQVLKVTAPLVNGRGQVVTEGAVLPDDPGGPDPLDPRAAGGDGQGTGDGGGSVFATVGRCIEALSTSCTTVDDCAAGEFCDSATSSCKRDHGTCRNVGDCPKIPSIGCVMGDGYTAAAADSDGDLIPDAIDNCPKVANPDQADADHDGIGDACDVETCGNGILEVDEQCDDGNLVPGDGCSPACRTEHGQCDDGIDNDGDGKVDFGEDPGCLSASSPTESPACDDGIDNDGDGKIDWNGGPGAEGTPDPDCVGRPWRNKETPDTTAGCGLGAELSLVFAALHMARRRRNRRS
ncbi:MAG TPA: myxococcus cysteine-rich repeat containing protein, partial [Myxococcota bacterium]|nr:myxococcus cysteine-rich repeat containing protein [Myxococcota bacterium]